MVWMIMTSIIEDNSKINLISPVRDLYFKIIFLVWADSSIRAESLSKHLGSHLYLINFKFKNKICFPIKYLILFAKTYHILRKERPEIIICQIPSIFCALSSMMCSYLLGLNINIVVDAHTGAFCEPWSHFKILNKIVIKRASITIVTNTELQKDISSDYGVQAVVLEDALPDLVSD
jgi:hypothetical protein